MIRYLFLIISPIALSGCMTIADYQQISSGKVGCSPSEISISNIVDNDPIYSWQAECNKRTYYCSAYVQGVRNSLFCQGQHTTAS